MKGNRYHDEIHRLGRLDFVIIAEEHRDHTIGLYGNELFFWFIFHKFKLRWWRK